MSAWDLYWILMLDNIRETCIGFSIILGSAAVIAGIFWMILGAAPVDESDKRIARTGRRVFCVALPLLVAFVLAMTFLPTTKQMAAILVLPKIATEENIEAVQEEAGDLYGLAKDWLEDQVESPEQGVSE